MVILLSGRIGMNAMSPVAEGNSGENERVTDLIMGDWIVTGVTMSLAPVMNKNVQVS